METEVLRDTETLSQRHRERHIQRPKGRGKNTDSWKEVQIKGKQRQVHTARHRDDGALKETDIRTHGGRTAEKQKETQERARKVDMDTEQKRDRNGVTDTYAQRDLGTQTPRERYEGTPTEMRRPECAERERETV